VVPIQLPILGVDSNFIGVVDLISMDTILWGTSPTSNSRAVIHPVLSKLDDSNSLLYESALSARKRMVEAIAEVDELFMEIYFAFEANLTDIPITDILSAIKRQCLRGVLIPAICGASLKSKGIQPLLDSIVTFLPSPLERPPVIARDTKNSVSKSISPTSMDLCALAFKVVYDEARGPLVFARVYSGTLPARQVLHNSTRNIKERASQILRVSADDLEHIDGIGAGEVACIVGLKKTLSGDTLVVEQGPLQNYVLEGLHLPKSVFALALEPEKSSQQDDLEKALNILCMEDPSLHVDVDKESGQTLIKGIGELHLEIVCDKLRRQFKIEVTTGRAYVAFRESLQLIENEDEVFAYEYDKVIGSKRLYAGMSFVITKRADIGSPELDYKVVSEQLTNEERVCLEESFQGCISRGPVGYPVVGFNVKIIEIDKNIHTCSGSLRACLSMAMNTVLKGPLQCLFEPLMSLEVYLPTEYLGDVLSDLSMRRRGLVREVKTEDASSIIIAHVPLVTMLGYASAIRSMTQGEGSFAMEYLEHVQVDDALAMDLTGHHT
jgi:elongation factor G